MREEPKSAELVRPRADLDELAGGLAGRTGRDVVVSSTSPSSHAGYG